MCKLTNKTFPIVNMSARLIFDPDLTQEEEPKEAYTIDQWLSTYEWILHEFQESGKVPPCHSSGQKCVAYCIGPVICTPCVSWSAVWRILAFPLICLCGNPLKSCTANKCTVISDACVHEFYHELGKSVKVAFPFPPKPMDTFSDADLSRYIIVLRKALTLLEPSSTRICEKRYQIPMRARYELADACFHGPPAKVTPIIRALLMDAMRIKKATLFNGNTF